MGRDAREKELAKWCASNLITSDGQLMRHIKIAEKHPAVKVEWRVADYEFEKLWKESANKDIRRAFNKAKTAGLTLEYTTNPYR